MSYHFDPATGQITMADQPTRDAAQMNVGFGFGGSGYRGAQTSPYRNTGYWGYPEVAMGGKEHPDLDSYSRTQLRNLSDHFTKNSGFVRRLFNGTARYAIGRGIVPYATTRDKAWNQAAEEYFDDWARSRGQFSVCARHSFYTSQKLMGRNTFRLGAMLAIKSTTVRGDKPQIQFLEPQRVRGEEENGNWIDGQKLNARGRTLAYRVIKPDGSRERIINANKIAHVYDPERGCQTHGNPWLTAVLHKLVDFDDMESAATAGVKLDQSIGIAIKSNAPDGGPGLGAEATVTRSRSDGDTDGPDETITQEHIFGSNAIVRLRDRESIESIKGENPGERLESWLAFQIRTISWAFGCSPELAWNIAGVGGAPMRWILQDGQLFFEEVQDLLRERYLTEIWQYRIAHGIASGDLRSPEGDRPWWHPPGWIAPQKVTVDIGRDGKLSIELIKNALLSIPRYYRALGLDWQEEIGAHMDALEWIKKEAARRENLTAGEVTNLLPNIATAAFSE